VLPVLAIAGWWIASQLPQSLRPTGTPPVASDALFRLPSSAVLLLCLMPLGIMAVEGAFIDWSAVFMRSILNASSADIGIAYAFFSGVMAATRLLGDRLAERFGDLAIVRLSGVAATLGITLFALAPTVIIAYGAAALSGMGVAIVYPLAVSAAARRPGRTPADNVAALTMVSFSAFLFAPPFIGFLSEAIGLRRALLALAPLAFFTVLLAREVVRAK
jgi:MFS family permease